MNEEWNKLWVCFSLLLRKLFEILNSDRGSVCVYLQILFFLQIILRQNNCESFVLP